MSPDADAVARLTRALEAVPRMKELAHRSPERVVGSREFQQWREDSVSSLADLFGRDSSEARALASVQYSPINFYFGASDAAFREYYFRGLDSAAAVLTSAVRQASTCGDASEASTSALTSLDSSEQPNDQP